MFILGISAINILGNDFRILGYLVSFVGACFTLLSIPNLTTIQNLNWTSESIDGPKAIMRLSRHEMKWSEIVKIGTLKYSIFYLEDKNQGRIYWSQEGYEGPHSFETAVKRYRPNLEWP